MLRHATPYRVNSLSSLLLYGIIPGWILRDRRETGGGVDGLGIVAAKGEEEEGGSMQLEGIILQLT